MSNNTNGTNSITDQVGNLINEANQRTIGPAGVGTNLALWSAISLATVIIFNILRPQNKIVYQPKVKYHLGDKKPPPISDGLFAWIPPIIHSKEPYLLEKIGLDAVVFLRFLRMLRWLFLAIAFLSCAVLLPINATYNLAHVPKEDRDALTMLTIRDVRGRRLFIHIGAGYVFTILVMIFVYFNWKAVVRLRHTYFRSPEYTDSFYARTLLVRHVPKQMQSDDGLKSLFAGLAVPYPATSVHIARRVNQLPEYVKYHNDAVRDLEKVVVRYLKGGKIGSKRPTITIGGFLGMGGTKKDAIEFYTNRIQNTERTIEGIREQIAASKGKAENYGFASMAAVPYTHIVAYTLRNKHPKGCRIESAPNPKDIIWDNLNATDAAIARKKTLGWIFLSVVAFFNTIPVFAISILANLNAIAHYVPFLANIANDHLYLFSFISGVAPPTVSAIFGYFFPYMMRWLSRYQGAYTQSRLDRAVVARYFAFLIISQLLIFTLIGVVFNAAQAIALKIGKSSFGEIVHNLDTLPELINSTYINQSSYWLTFFPLRGFLVVFDLAQVLKLVWTPIRTRLFGRTPRDIRDWTQPSDFEYAIYYVNILFMAAVGLLFAPLAPVVPAMACIVLWISSIVYKYQLMFAFVTQVESGGRLWNVVINRLLISVIFMQGLFTLTIGLQLGWSSFEWVATLPPIVIIIIFKAYIKRTFSSQFRYYIPNDQEIAQSKVHSERADRKGNRLANRFGHPALHADLFTPMLHANMMDLLPMVYKGTLASDKAKLTEYGGQSMDARVTAQGLRIAAIGQNDLEYDPVLWQRDRGELDWDQRSMASTNYLNDAASTLQASKSGFFAPGGRDSPAPRIPGYDQYIAMGPGGLTEDNTPLLYDTPSRYNLAPTESGTSVASYNSQQMQQPVPPDMQYPPSSFSQRPGGYPGQIPRSYSPSQLPGPRSYSPSQLPGPRSYSPSQLPGPRSYSPAQMGPRSQSPAQGNNPPRLHTQTSSQSSLSRPYSPAQGPYPHTRGMSQDSMNMAGRGAGNFRR